MKSLRLVADAGQQKSDVVFAMLAQCLGDGVTGGGQGGGGTGQGGAKRVAQCGQAGIEGPGPAFHKPVGVQRQRRSGRQADLGGLEGFRGQAEWETRGQLQQRGLSARSVRLEY